MKTPGMKTPVKSEKQTLKDIESNRREIAKNFLYENNIKGWKSASPDQIKNLKQLIKETEDAAMSATLANQASRKAMASAIPQAAAAQSVPTIPIASSNLQKVSQPLGLQQQLLDRQMQQASQLPANQRAQFAENFQKSATSGTGSTFRPGTTFGNAGNIQATSLKKGGKVSSASKRADGIAKRWKTRGRIV